VSLTLQIRVYLLLACLATALPAFAQQDTLQVLILNSYDESAAPYFRPTEEFRKQLQRKYTTPIAFQDIDLRQKGIDPQDQVDETIVQLLLSRYGELPPQLVVAIGPPAINFWVNNRDSTFPDALFIAMARESILRATLLQPDDGAVATRFSFTGVIENILRLKPETSHIVMIFGDSPSERVLSAAARKELEPWSERFSLEFTNDLAIHEIQEKVAQLTPNSVVFYGFLSSDVNGVSLQHYSGLAVIRAASKAPVFGAFDDQLGHGIIGGSLIQATRIGVDLAEAAQDLLRGKTENPPWRVVDLSPPTYDWRELQTWGISLELLPPGSKVLFEQPSFWKHYAKWIFAATFVFLAQTWIVLALLRQRRQRRKAELAHASLGRRLITAHEDERRLIARELHDDLSQRLARASMDASYARSHPGTATTTEVLNQLQPELVNISKDVHDMSYRLHPSLVDDLGLVAALRSEIERVQRRVDVTITSKLDDIRDKLPPDMALCIFRVAQEAMQNAVKHAKAKTIKVILEQDSEQIMLTVQDDGIGFDLAETQDTFSLGLSSMKERALLVNGRLNIRSQPGKTRLTLSAPWSRGGP
jgi:signal transduction histidine kinase